MCSYCNKYSCYMLFTSVISVCLHGEFAGPSQATKTLFSTIFSTLFFSLPPEGLKKVRNPDRMYRSTVCYAGHGPPKSISDDAETNSKSQLLILHCCSVRPLAGQSIIHSSIHLFTPRFHLPPPYMYPSFCCSQT